MNMMQRKIKKSMMTKQGNRLKILRKSKISIGVSMASLMRKKLKLLGTSTNLLSKLTKMHHIGTKSKSSMRDTSLWPKWNTKQTQINLSSQ